MAVFDYSRGYQIASQPSYIQGIGYQNEPTSQQPDVLSSLNQARQGYNIYQQYWGGGEQLNLSSLFSSTPSAAPAASTSAAPTTASGGSGAGSALGGMGWWAALAAVIAGNEEEARKKGRRDEDTSSRITDMFSGAVLEQDFDYYGDKVGGFGGEIIKGVGQLGNPEGTWNLIKDIF